MEQIKVVVENKAYRAMCRDVESMIDELPPGSSIGSQGDSYLIKMPIGSVVSDTVAEAYTAAMDMVNDKQGKVT